MATNVPGSRVTAIDPGQVMLAATRGKPHIRLRTDGSFLIEGVAGPRDFFGPLQPLLPLAQDDARGRQFDYPVGWNVRITPRQQEGLDWQTLKNLADGYDVLRTIIETRKDQVAGATWTVGPKDDDAKRDKRSDVLEDFWRSPDRVHSWADWIRMLLEQMFVLDAPACYARQNRGGGFYGLEILDGATINRLITEDGRMPTPAEGPAFQQILKGLPAVDYTADEILYKPRNPRVDKIYGFSPVEQIVTTVNIALNRQLYQLNYYTQGATPDLIFETPATWNPDQVVRFKANWDSMLQGNLANRRGTMFVPAGAKPYDTKEKALKDEYDEWLTRICCFAFSISPTPFVKQNNRATAEIAHQQASQEGIEPLLRWIVDFANVVHTKYFGWPDLTIRFDEDEAIDPTEQATIYGLYVDKKIYHPDEIRQMLGDDPMETNLRDQMDQPTFSMAANATVLPKDQQAAADKRTAAHAEAATAHAVTVAGAQPASPKPDEPAATEKLLKILAALHPTINVATPAVNVTTPPVTVNQGDVHVTTPEVKGGDTFVDIGATTMQAKFDAPRGGIGKTVTAERTADGKLVGTITDGVTRTVVAKRDDDGKLVAKIEE